MDIFEGKTLKKLWLSFDKRAKLTKGSAVCFAEKGSQNFLIKIGQFLELITKRQLTSPLTRVLFFYLDHLMLHSYSTSSFKCRGSTSQSGGSDPIIDLYLPGNTSNLGLHPPACVNIVDELNRLATTAGPNSSCPRQKSLNLSMGFKQLVVM